MNDGLKFQAALAVSVKVFGALTAIVLTFVLTSQLGADEAGVFFLAVSVATFTASIASLGLRVTLLRIVSEAFSQANWSRINGAVNKSLAWSLFSSTIATVVLFFGADWISTVLFDNPDVAGCIRIASFSVAAIVLYELFSHAIQGAGQNGVSMLLRGPLQNFFLLLLVIFFGVLAANDAVLLFVPCVFVAVVLGAFVWWRSSEFQWTFKFPATTLRESCFPLFVVQVVYQLNTYASQFYLAKWTEPADISRYTVAIRLVSLIGFVLIAINHVSASRFATLWKNQELEKLTNIVRLANRMMLVLSLPIVLVFVVAPGWILSWFGPEFPSAAPLLVLLALGQAVNVATGSVGYLLMMSGHEKEQRNCTLMAAVLSLVAGLVLVPKYGLMGAGIMTFIWMSTGNLLSWIVVRKKLNIRPGF